MYKYRGKYKKSRTCVHAIEVMMVMVQVKDSCPDKTNYSSGPMSDKYHCEKCKHHEERLS